MNGLTPLSIPSSSPIPTPSPEPAPQLGVIKSADTKTFTVRARNGACDNENGILEECIAVQRIGKGAFGHVYLAYPNERNSPRALKFDTTNDSSTFEHEYLFFRKNSGVGHTLQLRAGNFPKKMLSFDFIPIKNLAIEARKKPFSLSEICLIFKQGLEALSKWHANEYAHLDLKFENSLYERQAHLLTLIDGGLSSKIPRGQTHAGTWRGTPYMAPPEMWFKNRFDHSVDIWLLGLMIFKLYVPHLGHSNLLPFKINTPLHQVGQTFEHVLGPIPLSFFDEEKGRIKEVARKEGGKVIFNEQFTPAGNKNWRGLMRAWGHQRKDSPEKTEQLISLLERMLCYQNRIKPEEALQSPLFEPIFDFHLSVPNNLRGEWSLELMDRNGESVAEYPLRQRINDTCLHLYEQTLGKKKAVYSPIIHKKTNSKLVLNKYFPARLISQGTHLTVRLDEDKNEIELSEEKEDQ